MGTATVGTATNSFRRHFMVGFPPLGGCPHQNPLASAGTGALSGFLIGELDKLLGINTATFGGQLVNVAGNTLLNKVLTNIAGGQGVFNGIDGTIVSNLPGAIGGFLGSYLAHEVLHAESAIGAIGGNIGGTLGSALAAANDNAPIASAKDAILSKEAA